MGIFAPQRRGRGPRRQWGADANTDPMPAVPRIAGDWAMAFGRGAVVVTVAAWAALVVTVLNGQVIEGVAGHASLFETVGFLTAVSLLAASATAYLFGRLGFYYRARNHRRVPRAMLDEFFAERRPSVTALVPSYQEEPGVILMTLLSTALQEYPDLRVVLLIDDPPNPRYAGPRRAARPAPRRCPPRSSGCSPSRAGASTAALARLRDDRRPGTADPSAEEVDALADEYEYAGAWIRSLGDQYQVTDHNEALLRRPRARPARRRADADRRSAARRRRRRPGEARRSRGWPSSTAASPGPSAPRSRASSASATPRSRPSRTRR